MDTFYDALQRFKTRALLDRIKDPRGKAALAGAITQPMTAARLREHVLRRGELLLDIVTGAERSYMFAVTSDSCRLVPLPGWRSPLHRSVTVFNGIMAEPLRAGNRSVRFETPRRSLGDAVLGPVADLVAGADRVIVAADGFYATIPFVMLVPGGIGMLLDSKDVIDVPSASVLAWARADTIGARSTAASLIAVGEGPRTGLPGAKREINALRRRYANVTVMTARPGVLDTLSRHARTNGILHIAAHARVSDESPWQSGFLLDPASSGAMTNAMPRGETVLRAWEIARAELPYAMAVLAGCETAAGRATNGEGVLGLTSAFLSAGVPVVVSSRWRVDDRATATLMGHFYDGLARGETVAAALRRAQLTVRADRRTSHPFYWAGFTVVGDGARVIAPLKRAPGPDLWRVVYGGLGALLGVVGWRIYRRRFAPSPG